MITPLLALWLAGCASPGDAGPPARVRPNIVIVIADDLGTDKVGAYGLNPEAPPTPTIDALAAEGVLFHNAHVYSVCSPTRATLLTGEPAHRTKIGWWLWSNSPHGLGLSWPTVAKALGGTPPGPYQTSAVGKWHVGRGFDDTRHPLLMGFDDHRGTLYNLSRQLPDGTRDSYYRFEKSVNGEPVIVEKYATTDTTDDALARVEVMSEPWLLWVAYNAPHVPYQLPPEELYTQPLSEAPSETEIHDAMVEALDTELGRLLRDMDPDVRERTIIVFLGDNGTLGSVKDGPQRGEPGKHTLYQGGVNVPLIVTGPVVSEPGSEVDALIEATDLFATVLEWAGLPYFSPEHSVSFAPYVADPSHPPQRTYVHAEQFSPSGPGPYDWEERMIRDTRYKVIHRLGEGDEFYDLQTDPREHDDLIGGGEPDAVLSTEQLEAYIRLLDELDRVREP